MIARLRIAAIVLLIATSAGVGDLRARNNRAKENENDGIGIFAAVLESEVAANHWADTDAICFSVDGKDPSKKLVDALRARKLNVCRQSAWRQKLACGFSIWVEPIIFDSPEQASVRFQSTDLREVNTGSSHFAIELRDGEYSLKNNAGAWSIVKYIPKEHPGS